MIETRDLKSMARQTAELALQLAGLPADGSRNEVQALDEIEQLAARIIREAPAGVFREARTAIDYEDCS